MRGGVQQRSDSARGEPAIPAAAVGLPAAVREPGQEMVASGGELGLAQSEQARAVALPSAATGGSAAGCGAISDGSAGGAGAGRSAGAAARGLRGTAVPGGGSTGGGTGRRSETGSALGGTPLAAGISSLGAPAPADAAAGVGEAGTLPSQSPPPSTQPAVGPEGWDTR
jgi:hypothetical protein